MKQQLCTIALSGLLAHWHECRRFERRTPCSRRAVMRNSRASMQGPGGMRHGMDPDQQLAHMTKRYNLSAEQQTQLKPILAGPSTADDGNAFRHIDVPSGQDGQDAESCSRII